MSPSSFVRLIVMIFSLRQRIWTAITALILFSSHSFCVLSVSLCAPFIFFHRFHVSDYVLLYLFVSFCFPCSDILPEYCIFWFSFGVLSDSDAVDMSHFLSVILRSFHAFCIIPEFGILSISCPIFSISWINISNTCMWLFLAVYISVSRLLLSFTTPTLEGQTRKHEPFPIFTNSIIVNHFQKPCS